MELALFNPVETNSNDGLLGILALLALPGLILLCVYCAVAAKSKCYDVVKHNISIQPHYISLMWKDT